MEKTANYVKILNYILIFIASAYFIIFLFFVIRACVENPKTVAEISIGPINNIGTAMFVFLGVVFFIVGISMNLSLKWHFPEFYLQYRCLLWIATLMLTCPLFIRAIKDHEYWHNSNFA